MFIDTHVHLLDHRFDGDREDVLCRARGRGAAAIVEIGCEPDRWQETLSFARMHTGVAAVLGIHPQEARLFSPETMQALAALCRAPEVAGIGETGFDYRYENSPRQAQKESFLAHVGLARELQKPLVIHCREAYPDLLSLLDAERAASPLPAGVVHCFSGTADEALALVAMGFMIGIDGPVTYPAAKTLRACVEAVPFERLVLETDSPYLPPQPFRGKRNEPSHLPLIAAEVAKIKGVSPTEAADITMKNAERLFAVTAFRRPSGVSPREHS